MEVGGTTSASSVGVKSRLSAMHRCGRFSAFSDLSLAPLHLRHYSIDKTQLSIPLSLFSPKIRLCIPSCISSNCIIHLRNASRPHRGHRPRRLRRPPPNARLPYRLQDLNPLPQTSRPSRGPTQSTRNNTQELRRVSGPAPRAIEGCRRRSLGTRDFLDTSIETVCLPLSL